MIFNGILATLAFLSFALTLWQWLVARRFPLHQQAATSFSPAATILKPLKGCDEFTESCLRSWFTQKYDGEIQILFGVETESDPACVIVEKLRREFPYRDAQLIVCSETIGTNAKVSKLAQLEPHAKHDVIVVSDADVLVPEDFLKNAVQPLSDKAVGLVNCFYRLANPATPAMHWEAVYINADFWSQVLQSRSLRPQNFALGAAMTMHRKLLTEIGGFRALADFLADDYQLGQRIAAKDRRIELCPLVVECWLPPMNWRTVWQHQIRWARTIRGCQPVPYFFSILGNATLWPLLWMVISIPGILTCCSQTSPGMVFSAIHLPYSFLLASILVAARILIALDMERRLSPPRMKWEIFWAVTVKDILQAAIWLCAFTGNIVDWRGEKYQLKRDGTIERC